MEHSPSPAEFHQDYSINFDYASLNTYPAYEIHNMSSPRLGAFNSLNLNNSTIPYYSSSSADGSPSPYVTASPVQSSLAFHPTSTANASNPSATTPTPGIPSQVSTTRPFSPSQSISPPLTNLSASDLSADNLAGPAPFSLGIAIGPNHHPHAQHTPHGRARAMSSGTGSPGSSYASAGSLNGLGPHRTKSYGVAGIVNGQREKRRRATKREEDDDDDDEDEDDNINGVLPTSEVSGSPPSRRSSVDTSLFISVVAKRREEIRRQRIESEQRRRDELRDGYRKLKEVLPASNQKSSKVSLLDRATTHIRYLELTTAQMVQKVAELEAETQRLRQVNETLMLSAAERSRIAAVTGNGNF
ncbi:hypothetical protein FRC04_008829 [Tulasnella sp. 424]|nr:hypothetical protein FRC04_008829 [Tulasnella sp. 424]KAG8980056.1 hypothetical protein FRC05_007499 [Tulasnella sp. 425]